MRKTERSKDSVVLVNLTAAAVLFGNLLVVKGVHALVIKEGFESREDLAASLVNLYAKCGDLLSAREVFDSLCCKNAVLWTSMLNAFDSIPADFFQGRQPARRSRAAGPRHHSPDHRGVARQQQFPRSRPRAQGGQLHLLRQRLLRRQIRLLALRWWATWSDGVANFC
jgi:hypothetical protein